MRALLVALLWLLCAKVLAAPLLLDEVLASVDGAHPLLRAAEQDRAAAAGERLSAEGAFDPVWRTRLGAVPLGAYQNGRLETGIEVPTPLWGLTLWGGYRLGLGKFAEYDGKLRTGSEGEVRAGLLLPLWRNGPIDRRRANIGRAELGQEVARQGVAQQRLDLRRVAAQRYFEWVAAGQRLRVAERLLALARARDEGLGERAQRGDLPRVERVDNTRAIIAREGGVVSARRAMEQAAIELSLYLRDGQGAPMQPGAGRLPERLPEPTLPPGEESDAELEQRRPDLLRLRALRAQGEVERRWASNQRAPGIDLSVQVARDLGQLPQGVAPVEVEAGLVLDIPIPNRAAIGRLRAAEAGVARVDAQARFQRDRARAEIRDARSAIGAARERVELARREVGVARELEEAERARLDLGDGTLLFVNLREQAAAEAELREIDALLELQRAALSYRAALASL